jgi:hypothetical protein
VRFAAVRKSGRHDPEVWHTNADYLEGLSCLRHGRFREALGLLRSAATNGRGIHPIYPELSAVICLHFLGQHDDAEALMSVVRRRAEHQSWYFLDLSVPFVEVLLAAAEDRSERMRSQLGTIIARTRERYPHLPSAWGFALQAAVVVASASGENTTAAALFAGSASLGFHRRYDGAYLSGRVYGMRARDALEEKELALATERGRGMTLEELTFLAEQVARSGIPISPRQPS